MRILILGGTTEASGLAECVAAHQELDATLSLAGRTQHPKLPPIPTRIGGFGGVAGLIAYLVAEQIQAVVDATHPFAQGITRNAEAACARAGVPLGVLGRLPWAPQAGDRWADVPDTPTAVCALGEPAKRVFLTVGRLSLDGFAAAPQHYYLVRVIDPLDARLVLPHSRVIAARGPFDAAAEYNLMGRERIEVLVSKNSGGTATYPKIEAARRLGIPVVMIHRPPASGAVALGSVDAVLAWLQSHGTATP